MSRTLITAPPDFGRPQLVARGRRASVRVSRRALVVIVAIAAVTLILALVALATGSYSLTLGQVIAALSGRETGIVSTVVLDWRLPRVLLAILFGLALGISGAIFQSLTRNPLGSPDIIGFDTGAYTGALLVMLVLHLGGTYSITIAAIAGGLATAAIVYLFAWRRGVQGFRLIIAGIGVTAMLTSFNTWLLLRAQTQQAISASFWGAGSLDNAGYPQLVPAVIAFAVLFPAAGLLSRGMHTLELGDDAARQLGVNAERTRLLLVITGVALSATATALAGPIAFISLSAPQIARRLTRSAGVGLMSSAVVGAALLLASDWVAQHALPVTIPTGLVTVTLGGGYFIWLLVVEGRRR
ncbi:FecCD family ABC transporter permease [Gryllotalpicola koreensis]|uniref:Iron chelate uptake ABC transporter family permease subunit n=1 Tax=Gryllotalpicola koreensis TaxID=993086 RepID=A0ABP7ZV51_9MICO